MGPPAAAPVSHGEVASVYVHAPFCARRCGYCDFAVQVRRSGDAAAWARALAAELAATEAEGVFRLAGRLETLYVGGGTPSLLGAGAMDRLAEVIGRDRLTGSSLEWTAEANPESFTEEVARGWRRAGVNRLSLGVQTFDPGALAWMGRLHGPEGAAEAVARARRAGLDNLSVDLIFSLPEALGRDWSGDLARALALEPPHLSLYGLTVEPETPLGRAVAEGRQAVADENRYREEYLEAAERLTAAGYLHYEVSNFALPGHESRHNSVYWDGRPYLGLGNSAHSYQHPLRRWNLREWDAYERTAAEGRLPVQGEERLDDAAARLERIWLGLRTSVGLREEDLPPPAARVLSGWVARGWAERRGSMVHLRAEGWLLLDRLTVELDRAVESWESNTGPGTT